MGIVPKKVGTVVEKFFKSIPGIDQYVIMPNHIHLIVKNENGTMWASSPTVSPPDRFQGELCKWVAAGDKQLSDALVDAFKDKLKD